MYSFHQRGTKLEYFHALFKSDISSLTAISLTSVLSTISIYRLVTTNIWIFLYGVPVVFFGQALSGEEVWTGRNMIQAVRPHPPCST
jgi:hypothetical protein